uniref:Ig-like domain-containing protein n=1 Tax=Timema poppense TaxID=170557 RepID=A0A7R9GTS4_TIMPO|nr:unnamed protein product [Timema poppensis]
MTGVELQLGRYREIERATKVLLDLLIFWSQLGQPGHSRLPLTLWYGCPSSDLTNGSGEPITEILGGPDLFINKGSTINLTCLVKFAPEPPPAMLWSHKRESTITVNVYVTRVIHLNYLCSLRMINCVYLRYVNSGFAHPLVGQSDPLTGHAGPLTLQAGSYTGHANIHIEHASPITRHDCPYTVHSGPLTRHTDSYTGHASPHIGDATPLHSLDTIALKNRHSDPSLDMLSYSLGTSTYLLGTLARSLDSLAYSLATVAYSQYILAHSLDTLAHSMDNLAYSLATVAYSLDTLAHSLYILAHSLDTLAHSLDTLAHSLGKLAHSLDTLARSLGNLAYSLATVAHSMDTLAHSLDTLAHLQDTRVHSIHTLDYSLDMLHTYKNPSLLPGTLVINFDSPRGGISLVTEKGPVTTSRLLIQKAIPTDTGLYTCDPSNANPASVTVHILNGEHPAAMHHGKATTLRCPPPSALVVIATWMLVIHEI